MVSPLSDLRVLDMSRVVAGPFATRMLSDLGAEVVKVEPPEGDVTRLWGDQRDGLAGFYFQQNAGKENICVDLRRRGGPELIRRLAQRADVLVENFRPGVMGRHGLAWDDLRDANPGLIMLSISGFGARGPMADRPAYAPIIHAEVGLIARQARFDGNCPSDPMFSFADTHASLHGLVAVLAAVHLRSRTGVGQHIDMAMFDAMLATDDYAHHLTDANWPIQRLGGHVFEAAGGPILLAGEMRYLWWLVHNRAGVADPAPDGADLETKVRTRRAAVAAWIAAFPQRSELTARLDDLGIPHAEVREPEDVLSFPTIGPRGMVAEVPDRAGGVRSLVNSPYRFSDAEAGVRVGAAHRGEHNQTVLRRWLELDSEEIERLSGEGVILTASEQGDADGH